MKPILIILLTAFILAASVDAFSQAPSINYNDPYTFSVGTAVNVSPTNSGGTISINGQTTTVAGNSSAGYINAIGTAASFNQPLGAVVDKNGNIYVTDVGNEVIRKIAPDGSVSTFAGSGTPGSSDGTGTGASFYHPVGMCIDANQNIYVADEDNNMIRKITPAGVVTTLAGQTSAGWVDGGPSVAKFNLPCGIAVAPNGNVYVADDGNNRIRMITPTGTVSTLAGSGSAAFADGQGTGASFNQPFSVTIDNSGTLLYVADRYNHRIRKVTLGGAVSTLAGNGTAAYFDSATGTLAEFNYPTTVTVDKLGNVYVADYHNNRIRKITPAGATSTLSGTGVAGATNDIGSASTFNYPFAVAFDAADNVIVCDLNTNLIRKVVSTPYTISGTLPAGLSFNSASGAITGTPTTITAAGNYTVTAYSLLSNSNSTTNVNIGIDAAGSVNPSQNQNFIAAYIPRVLSINTSTGLNSWAIDKTQVQVQIQYTDGLGRPLQTVQAKGSPTGNDIVESTAYDQYDRASVKYLPYANNPANLNDGSYKADAIGTQQPKFYNSATTWASNIATTSYPATGTDFESSALNRVIETGAPGQSWQLSNSSVPNSGHTVKIAYSVNPANDVINWTANSNGNGATGSAYYGVNMLDMTTKTDENGNNTIEYKDMQGRVVCKKAQSGSSFLTTYYVYDDYGNLVYAIPPIPANVTYPNSFTETDPVCLNYIYGYHYDNQNRLVEMKIPGKDIEYIVYNNNNQVVATQDGNQRLNNQWVFTKYDGQGRVIQTGIWNNGNSAITRLGLVTLVNNVAKYWESRPNGADYSTSNAWPTSWATTLTVNYYDDYSFPGRPYNATASGVSSSTTGLLTGTKSAVLNADGSFGSMLWTVNYYDDRGRLIESSKQHYLGGAANYSASNYDDISTGYDFTNEVTGTIRHHYTKASPSAAVLTSAISYYYDHMGRKTQTWQAVYTGSTATSSILLSQMDYNELGQVKTKHLHSATGSAPFLQDIAYAYNERGWLIQINDPAVAPSATKLFSLKLNYNLPQFGATAQFNGNIAEEQYNAGLGGNQHVVYSYDNLNRLTSGTSSIGYSETGISYDNLGNISTLTRSGPNGAVLAYNYTGNQLQTVTNSGNAFRSYGYDKNANATSDGTGNTISYNLLNMPRSIPGKGLTYFYSATGKKLEKIANGIVTEYISGLQYKTGGTIDFIMTDEGRAIKSGSSFNYEYTLTDQLGNNRVTFDQTTGKTGEDDYYPFGLNVHKLVNGTNNYLYNKKEMQPELNNQYDYGARFYDPVIGRWSSLDPMAEQYNNWSPYAYCKDNPISFFDFEGGKDVTPAEYRDFFLNYAVSLYQAAREKGASVRGALTLVSQMALESGFATNKGARLHHNPFSLKPNGEMMDFKDYNSAAGAFFRNLDKKWPTMMSTLKTSDFDADDIDQAYHTGDYEHLGGAYMERDSKNNYDYGEKILGANKSITRRFINALRQGIAANSAIIAKDSKIISDDLSKIKAAAAKGDMDAVKKATDDFNKTATETNDAQRKNDAYFEIIEDFDDI